MSKLISILILSFILRVLAKNQMENPAWHGSAGGATRLFVDEVRVK